MLAEINKAVAALKAAGNNKVRVVLFGTITPRKQISNITEFNIITQEGYCPSVLKSGKFAAHIVKHLQNAINNSAVAFEVVSLDNIDNRGS